MRRCAFLTLENSAGNIDDDALARDDELTYAPLQALGWNVETVPWRGLHVNWGEFDAIVIRSTWDYLDSPEAFVAVLEQIERSGARLENALNLVSWNIHKTYLRDIERRGVPIVPTVWGSDMGPIDAKTILGRLGTNDVVVKPTIGNNAIRTFWLSPNAVAWPNAVTWKDVAAAFEQGDYLAQPFMSSIIEEGEYSLFFFGGEFSHAILKTPKSQDFRVQEMHGGISKAIFPARDLILAGERVIDVLGQVPLYARVDFVRLENGRYGLMELELIEPSLYFRLDESAPVRFARALDRRFRLEAS